jgi:predicted extracellular nuclease
VENLWAGSDHLVNISDHIVHYLRSPDLVFVQEIQDDNGETNDAVVSANLTLTTLTSAISSISGPRYEFAEIDPVDDKNGGAPGGNIRTAYLYNPEVLQLRKPNFGSSTEANEVLPGPELKYNPGLIDPQNTAWTASRKPLVAAFETLDGKNSFFTINVHFGSKGGSSSIEGDARPPVNGGVDDRQEQMQLTAVSHARRAFRD